MLLVAYILNPLLMLAMPVALGIFLARRFGWRGATWRLFFIGAATFILSQVVHLPLNFGLDRLFDAGILPAPPERYQLPFNAVLLGLTAGLCEEIARYLVYRRWIREARTWPQALMFGAGHGGVEAMITGGLAGLGALNVVILSQTDLSTLPLTPVQLAELQGQMAAALSYPWFYPLLGALERVFALIFHLSAAVLVLQAVRRRNLLWLAAAILWHTLLNALALYVFVAAGPERGPYLSEAALAGLSLISLGIILALRDPALPIPSEADLPPALPVPAPTLAAPLEPPEATTEALEKTRYLR
jgi:uncharacterized membrane protein YhfC